MATIALVDDDRNILTSVSIALESEGYKVETYTDGASALDGLSAKRPDLAVFDIKMPRMDGMELLRRLRQKSDLPVIFLTSKDDEIDELFGLKMGADDFITKPFFSAFAGRTGARCIAAIRCSGRSSHTGRDKRLPHAGTRPSDNGSGTSYQPMDGPIGHVNSHRVSYFVCPGSAPRRGQIT